MNNIFNIYPALKMVYDQTSYRDIRSLVFLHRLVEKIKPHTVLELGTGKGCSTAFMATALEDGRVISVDSYEMLDPGGWELVTKNLKDCNVQDRVVLVKGSTFDVGNLCHQYCVDSASEIAFMDASHNDECLCVEYESMKLLLAEQHVIVVDDALANDIHAFLKKRVLDNKYPFYMMLPFHNGVAVLSTHHLPLMQSIYDVVIDCLNGETE